MFDLIGHTFRFTRDGSRYRVDNEPLHWDFDSGAELTGADVNLEFAFPFSGKSWHSLFVGTTGSISFGKPEDHTVVHELLHYFPLKAAPR